MISEDAGNRPPPPARHCGLLEDPRLLDLLVGLSRDPLPRPMPRLAPAGEDDDHFEEYTDPATGRARVYAATDGACSNQAHVLLARAGFGFCYGPGHRLNYSARVRGLAQSAQRAETLALLHPIATADRPAHVYVDNQAVVDGIEALLAGAPPLVKGAQADW